jgi:3-deoxy-8-phosphooctulonate synthase
MLYALGRQLGGVGRGKGKALAAMEVGVLAQETGGVESADHGGIDEYCLEIVLLGQPGGVVSAQGTAHVVAKARQGGEGRCPGIMVTERGASFGYNNLVVDMRSLPLLAELGVPVCFDATHAVQLPGGQGDRSGGQRAFVPPLARAAVAVGIDALFLEVHDDPDQALSDGPNMVPLAALPDLLRAVQILDRARRSAPKVEL